MNFGYAVGQLGGGFAAMKNGDFMPHLGEALHAIEADKFCAANKYYTHHFSPT
jgi:hypothetical protein